MPQPSRAEQVALSKLAAKNDIDKEEEASRSDVDKEKVRKELKQARREVHALNKDLKQVKLQVRERKQGVGVLANRLHNAMDDIDYLRKCEEEWLRELEREVMRPVVGVEVHEIPYPDGTLGLVVTAVAQKGTAHKAGVQIGDIVSKFGKTDVQSKTDFAKALLASPIGSKQNMQVIRRSMAPIGKPCTSVEWLSIVIAGAVPTGFSVEMLRSAPDPEELVRRCKQEGVRALAPVGSPAPISAEGS
uniref:PDZ domain-containing protein n=1 Tax=Eutreptiella gymnastica TaxID=73025 RepID=A0A7S4G376_9EUGL